MPPDPQLFSALIISKIDQFEKLLNFTNTSQSSDDDDDSDLSFLLKFFYQSDGDNTLRKTKNV